MCCIMALTCLISILVWWTEANGTVISLSYRKDFIAQISRFSTSAGVQTVKLRNFNINRGDANNSEYIGLDRCI